LFPIPAALILFKENVVAQTEVNGPPHKPKLTALQQVIQLMLKKRACARTGPGWTRQGLVIIG